MSDPRSWTCRVFGHKWHEFHDDGKFVGLVCLRCFKEWRP